MLRGNSPAKIDEKGRLKVPSLFRSFVEQEFGLEVFVTSLRGESVRIYPMPVWNEIERKLAAVPSTLPARARFFDRVNYYGQTAELDKQGRVLIHPLLREVADMNGEVDVFGLYNYLEVWNHDRFIAKLQREPYTDDDASVLAQYGI